MAVYKKEVIKRWLNDAVDRLFLTAEQREMIRSKEIEFLPENEYHQRLKELNR